MCRIGSLFLCVFLAGCGLRVSYLPGEASGRLASMRTVEFELEVVSAAVSTERSVGAYATGSAAVAGGSDSVMDGRMQAELAAKDMLFELRAKGISAASTTERPDAVALFSIGAVRYRRQWVADQAFLEFRAPESGDLIGTFRAESGSCPTPVRDFTRALAKKIHRTVEKTRK